MPAIDNDDGFQVEALPVSAQWGGGRLIAAASLWHDGLMPNSVAIVVSGFQIAIAIIFANRWQMMATNQQILRLDRWTGKMTACNAPPPTVIYNLANLPAGLDFLCDKQ